MATQVKYGLPNGDFSVIDNSAAPVVITASGTPQITNGQTGINFDKATLGFDTTAPGSQSQCANVFGDTGSVLVDPVNDVLCPDPQIATYPGNPVLQTAPTFAKASQPLNNPLSATITWKNPA